MKRSKTLLLLLALVACSPEITQRAHPAPSHASRSSAAELAPQDRDFLERAAEGGNAEIAIGNLPKGRTERSEVVGFGQRMISQHSATNRQLAALAARRKIALPTSLGEHQASWDRLDGRSRYDFDVEFAKVMVEDHDQAAELFRNEATEGADPEIRAFAASTLPMIEAHLRQAKALATLLQ